MRMEMYAAVWCGVGRLNRVAQPLVRTLFVGGIPDLSRVGWLCICLYQQSPFAFCAGHAPIGVEPGA